MSTKKVKIPSIRTRGNFVLHSDDVEHSKGQSLTIQGESFSIQDLIKKYAGGIHPEVQRKEYFDDDVTHDDYDMEELRNADLVDQQEVLKKQSDKQKLFKEQEEKALKERQEYEAKVKAESAGELAKLKAETEEQSSAKEE